MKKKIVRYLLVLALTVTMLPAFSVQADAVTSITEETVISRLNSAESVWKNGAVFNDSKTLAKSCFGFGRELFHYVFNDSLPARWSTVTARFDVQQYMNNVTEIQHLSKGYTLDELKSLLAKAKPGDFLIAASGRNHGVIIRSAAADGSSIRVYDANWNGKNGIRTNAVWTAADMRRQRPIAVTLYRYAGYVENVSTIGMATVEHTHQGGPSSSMRRSTPIATTTSALSAAKTIRTAAPPMWRPVRHATPASRSLPLPPPTIPT